jgi:Fe-S-cluster containining protein
MPFKIDKDIRDKKFNALYEIHETIPDTTCKRRNVCCNAGCPPMYFVEFINVLDYINENVSQKVLSKIASKCIDNYFSDEVIKPCPLFDDGCLIYDARPVNCRLYGQIPDEEYKKRQERESNEFVMSAQEIKIKMGLKDIEDVPLYNQCPHVEPIKDTGGIIDSERYNQIFEILNDIEHTFLSAMDLSIDLTSYKTFHDHYLWFTVGEDMLEKWTILKIYLSDDPILKNDFIEKMKDNIIGSKVKKIELL